MASSPATGAPGGLDGAAPGAGKLVRTRRGTELLLLIFDAVLVTLAFVLVEANQERALTLRIGYYGLAYLGLFTATHLAVRRWAPYADPLILPCAALLNGIGLVMIYRIDLGKAGPGTAGTLSGDAPRQVLWTLIGVLLFVGVLKLVSDHRVLARYGYTLGLAGLVLLVLPGILPGSLSEVNGAKVWLKFGLFNIQPGEFAKILLIAFFAAFLVAKRDLFSTAGKHFLGVELPRLRDLAPLLLALLAAVGVLVLERDLGNSLLIFGVFLVMLYPATERVSWVVIGLVPFVAGCLLAYHLFAHVQHRVGNWIDPFAHYNGTGYQMAQSLFGLATGGIGGTGLGKGHPSLIPEADTDFITAALGEELGIIGLAAILLVYLVLTMRGLRAALAVRDSFGKLLGAGLAFALAWQVFVVVGGASRLIPETGLTTPFLSYGGSSLLANYILIGLLLRISDAARRPKAPTHPRMRPGGGLAEASTVMVERDS
jgi:cell division protein FtsW (lipid II flippase)